MEVVGSPSSVGAGFDSYIHLLQLGGAGLPGPWRQPLVVRILPTADRADSARREADVQGWCADRAFPAPRVLAVLNPGDLLDLPVQVMERIAGVTMLDAIKRRPWQVGSLVDRLADLQLRLHRLDATGWPATGRGPTLADVRLSLPRRAAAVLDDAALQAAVARAEELAPRLEGAVQVVCHGDFHPLNVMVDGGDDWLIDWSDAGLGPREADVSRTLLLFEVASIAASNAIERVVLHRAGPRMGRRHRARYEAGAPLDVGLLRGWEALHALHGWSQVAMLHGGGFDGESSSVGMPARVPLELGEWLRRRFESDLADG